ncbi:MAG: ShlB/FhaC/HecB family hemolysin secretion/activation protein [Opitutaceae bacterium]|nr:ShlB/FhaC/HecB family hemolysin secretion/activation protein [Opitutaceae bacterium]
MILPKRFPACAALCLLAALRATAQTPPPAAPATIPAPQRVFHHLLVAESVEAAQTLFPDTASGFVVLSPGLVLFDLAELNHRLAPARGRPIEQNILGAIENALEAYFREAGYPKADAIVPSQSIAEGHIRFIVTLGEKNAAAKPPSVWGIRNIDMKGGRWFSHSLLQDNLRIGQGRTIALSELEQAINWTNNNPFRRVKVHLEPVPNSTAEADLTVTVLDALPLRVSATIDNAGNDAIGKRRYIAAASYSNLWGLDHQLGYQFITTDKARFFRVHGMDYRVPLPWRHTLQASASYLEAKPEFFGGVFISKGESINADLRYSLPLRFGNNSLEASASVSFKQTNNNLLFFDTLAQTTKTDIVQFTFGLSGVWRDRRGAWGLGANVTASPGGLTPRNTTTAFDAGRHGGGDSARLGATASYIYLNVSAQRFLTLAPGWDLLFRGTAQISQANLLASEQINLGGANSVRGFQENSASGDNGFVLSTEFMPPSWKVNIPRISKLRGPLESRLLAFVDLGDTSLRRNLAHERNRNALASAGVGLRSNLAHHFSLTFDYGWQLSQPNADQRAAGAERDRGRGHAKATLAF